MEADVYIDEVDITLKISSITLMLSIYNAPLVRFQIESSDNNIHKKVFTAIMQKSLCYIKYHNSEIEILLSAIHETTYDQNNEIEGFSLEGYLMDKPLRKWFIYDPTKFTIRNDAPLLYLYQRSEKEPWEDFLNRVLDRKIYKGTGIDELCKNILANYGCLWRLRDWSNIFFLNQIVNYYRCITNNIEGWTIHNTKTQPVSLISRLNQAFKLGSGWDLYPSKEKNENDSFVAQRHFKHLDDKNRLKIIQQLAKRRRRFIQSERNLLPISPGPVKFDKNNVIFFARSIHYTFFPNVEKEKGIHVSVHITEWDNTPKSNPFQPIHIKTKFVDWVNKSQAKKAKGKLISLKPSGFDINDPGPKEWQFSKGGKPMQQHLYAKMITPTYVRDTEQGLYCTFKPDDELYCMLTPGQIPLCIGAQQKYNPHFDKEFISLNAEKLSFTASLPFIHSKLNEENVQINISRNDKINIYAEEMLAKGITSTDTKIHLDGKEGTILCNAEKACTTIGNDSFVDVREGKAKISSNKESAFIQVDGDAKDIILKSKDKIEFHADDKSEMILMPKYIKFKTGIIKQEANEKIELISKKVDIKTDELNVED